ncbi:3-keto-disaccharide hydrolase [Saccharopolyspora sp. CA-218241]|uniref:3-keto-disaccharide hydrolase n=1 Tax=Saccharopolyspora sp. CA-218241 TaxID=3240027 RepID=UPI003D983561
MRAKSTVTALVALVMALSGGSAAAAPVDGATAVTTRDRDCAKPIRLFDGHSLRGWSQAGPGGFDVEGGKLVSRGGMGLLWYSERTFADYELRLKWRVTAETDNSGVFLRFPDPGQDPWVAVDRGYEIQINDNPGGDPQKTGTVYNFQDPFRTASKPVGKWNEYRLVVVGQRYRIYLNDVLVNDFTSTDPARGTEGHVGLQNHDPDSRTEFRDIWIRPLHR